MVELFLSLLLFTADFLSVEEIKPGMEGIGETVFEGTKIDTFKVKIIGVLKNTSPKSDIILARLSGGPLERAGVIEGMSGSPVYIDNKLIGALSLRMGVFSKEPMAGITPISEMLKIPQKGEERASLKTSFPSNLTPIKIPLIISGADTRLFQWDSLWKRLGGEPIQGGGGPSGIDFVPKPGAAVGVELVSGDLSLTAMGTLTYVDEDRILAFGHDLFETGKAEYPLCGGYVHAILPSQLNSYKYISPLSTIGKITHDYRTGVMGKIGEYAKMVPLTVEIGRRPYRFEIINSSFLIPYLIAFSVANALYSEEGSPTELTLQLRTQIEVKGYPKIEYKDLYSGEGTIENLTAQFFKDIDSLLNNPFKRIDLHKIEVKIDALHEKRRADIMGLVAQRDKILLSEPLRLTIPLQLWEGERITEEVSLDIPSQGISGKELTIVLTTGDSIFVFDRPRVSNIHQFLEQFKKRPANNDLAIMVFSEAEEAEIEGERLPSLPPSLSSLLKHTEPTAQFNLFRSSLLLKKIIPTPYALSGKAVLKMRVERE